MRMIILTKKIEEELNKLAEGKFEINASDIEFNETEYEIVE